ncbi:hypothetical protein RhiirA5_437293 [Rhizophagus irregularis]|uniref:Uncharacterized protein n=1 Tax=Rhizophagus irregularis TaxID=588596 RepID=A0A2N0NKQ1_9GLOM|nr:hypothetical protein RhiirA5_437293 [Rhizophagus irregularis]
MSFLKRHMDVIDKKKTFKDQPRNTTAFTKFIHSAFNLFIQENLLEAESLQLQYIASLHNKNDSNEDLQDGLLNNDQEYETLEQFCNSESDFSMSSDELNNSEWSDTLDHEANQKTSDDLTDSEELINMEVIQETIEGKTKFEPLPGEYGPYFQNFTEMMLFTWITKHMISTKGYDDLICILKHPNFRTEHIIENVRRLRLLCNRLPLQTVKSHSIHIQNMKTPSTSKPFKDAYTISVTEHIKRVLENENLQSQMYFGPGVETDIKKEFWDGNLWQESPLLDKRTRIGRIIAIVSTSSDVKLKIQVLYYCDELPNNFRKLSRVQEAENGELWLSEVTSLINKDNIIEPIAVWLQDSLHLSSYQFYVKEILYSYEGRWKIRNVELRHHHLCEYTKIPSTAPQNIPTLLKLMLDIYYDDFGTFRTVYHSLGGIYFQFCNMPLQLRRQLRNHFIVSFVPFGGDFNDVMKPIINEIKSLKKGVLMTINQQNIWVIAALGVITADLPQGNDLADTKRHGGNLGCRSCLVSKDQLTDFTFDVILKARYHHLTDEKVDKLNKLIRQNASQKTINEYCTEHGLRKKPSILNQLTWNRHLQTPQDAYHSIAGKIQRLMECTFSMLKPSGEAAFLNYWKNLETPTAMVMPFLLRRSLAISHIKDFELNLLKERLISSTKSCPRPAQIINIIISSWVAVAKELKDTLRIEHDILLKVFTDNFTNLPNLHINQHHVQNARNFGTLVNISVGIKEMMHRIFKGSVSNMNMKNIELDFIRRYNTLQTIRHLIDGGKDDRFSTIGQGFLNLTTDPLLHPLLSDWYIMRDIQKETTTNDIDISITSTDSGIINIKVYKQLSKSEILQHNLPIQLDNNLQFKDDIINAYDYYMQKKAALIYRQQIRYTLLDDNGKFNSHLNLNIGAIVQIKEESGISYYAIIKAIFTHKYNDDLTRTFIWIDWMQESSTVDPILQCPIYELQKAENMRWYRVHPITTIDSHPKVHFLHNCRSTCTSDLHDARICSDLDANISSIGF